MKWGCWKYFFFIIESSAVCISEMLLHVSNGAYVEGICLSERFLVHVEALFSGVDELDKIHHEYEQGEFKYTREAKMLCKKIINFFSLLSRTQEMKRLGITQELLSLVTGLAHYLKILIRVALTTALRLELVLGRPVAVSRLLAKLMEVAGKESHSRDSQRLVKAKQSSDLCHVCRITVEDQCVKYGDLRWHVNCFCCRQCKRPLAREFHSSTFSSAGQSVLCYSCAGVHESEVPTPFEYVSKLTQFAYLLRVALSRLCNFLQITDSQLSSVDFSIKTKPYLPKDVPATKDVASSPTTMQQSKFPTSPVDEKLNTPAYPTHISDVKNVPATNLNRKVSRSFKTAKRSTILGNVHNQQKTQPISEEEDEESNNTRSGGVPARDSSLGIRLDDVPDLLKKSTTTSRHQHTSTMGTHIQVSATTGKPRVYLSELSALQDMIIRHVAVVHIEPYVREHFTLSELLNLIETKKVSIWGKFFTSIMHGGGKKQIKAKEDGTFNVPLDLLTERTGVESNLGSSPSPVRVAAFIDDAVTAMRQMDMTVEGIFRKNGNIRRLKDLTEQLDRNPQDVDLFAQPAIQIAALLKKFLRELPDPLMTYRLHGLFTCALKLSDPVASKRVLQLAYCMLPRVNRDATEVLFLFFRWVASFSHVTTDVGSLMDIPNLARVLAPNILSTNHKDPLKDDSFTSIRVIETMLESFDELCMVPEDLEPFLQDPKFKEGKPNDLSSKDFLKKVEQMMKHSNASTASSSSSSPISNMSSSTTTSVNDVRYLEVQQQHQQQQYQQHSPTSIYAQQGYLPYTNQHPSSDFRPNQLSMRQSSLNAAASQPPLK
ncbi:hypothetical protein BDC45DRAFT_125627 [Circinella umbellata]|nr:hypothetical protein BDC45DRAFT_125627 [Circinella umbellata]